LPFNKLEIDTTGLLVGSADCGLDKAD